MNRRDRMNEQIRQHGENLLRIFFNSTLEADKLARKVHSLEVKAHKLSTDYCNGAIEIDTWERETENILNKLDKVIFFRSRNVPVFVNGDARGYALKIDDEWMTKHRDEYKLHTDWGGYGILAPEFDGRP